VRDHRGLALGEIGDELGAVEGVPVRVAELDADVVGRIGGVLAEVLRLEGEAPLRRLRGVVEELREATMSSSRVSGQLNPAG